MKNLIILIFILLVGCDDGPRASAYQYQYVPKSKARIVIYTLGNGSYDGSTEWRTDSFKITGNVIRFVNQMHDSIISTAFTIYK